MLDVERRNEVGGSRSLVDLCGMGGGDWKLAKIQIS
jgi:hypothetical protein